MEAEEQVEQMQKKALIVGVIALAVSAIFAFSNPAQFFHSYLLAFVFWAGIALGSLAVLLLHQLTGGRWGAVIRRLLESATRTFPLLAILFLPILAGIHSIYEWSDAAKVAGDAALRHKQAYLNIPFFTGRTAFYFVVWIGLTLIVGRLSMQQDQDTEHDPALSRRFQKVGGFGLLLYGLTATFASFDWLMSLEPHWFSSMYGLMIIAGQVLSALAFVTTMAIILGKTKPFSEVLAPQHFHDLGNLILAFTMIWAYLSFSQFLIIWAGNLPEEIPWYLHRIYAGWQYVAFLLILFHFAIPFVLLLSRSIKQKMGSLIFVAAGILVMRLVDLFWLSAPEFQQNGISVSPLDVILPIGVGGIWLWMFFKQLASRPMVPLHDPNLMEEGHHE
jgi:hypothetical protein